MRSTIPTQIFQKQIFLRKEVLPNPFERQSVELCGEVRVEKMEMNGGRGAWGWKNRRGGWMRLRGG